MSYEGKSINFHKEISKCHITISLCLWHHIHAHVEANGWLYKAEKETKSKNWFCGPLFGILKLYVCLIKINLVCFCNFLALFLNDETWEFSGSACNHFCPNSRSWAGRVLTPMNGVGRRPGLGSPGLRPDAWGSWTRVAHPRQTCRATTTACSSGTSLLISVFFNASCL